MKVFVTLGFERRPFPRLLDAVDEGIQRGILPKETLVQRGHSHPSTQRCPSVAFLAYDEMIAALKSAEIIIAHAGAGTLLQCLHLRKIPILFPRRAHGREHVDDHQVKFARIMEERKRALVAYNSEQLFKVFSDYHLLAAEISAANGDLEGGDDLKTYLAQRLLKWDRAQG